MSIMNSKRGTALEPLGQALWNICHANLHFIGFMLSKLHSNDLITFRGSSLRQKRLPIDCLSFIISLGLVCSFFLNSFGDGRNKINLQQHLTVVPRIKCSLTSTPLIQPNFIAVSLIFGSSGAPLSVSDRSGSLCLCLSISS